MHKSYSITGVDQFHALAITEDHAEEAEAAKHSDATTHQVTSPFVDQGYTNVSSKGEGSRILFATDEWFAAADNLLKDEEPVFDPEAFCEQGKVMDGWESRRRREAGHDFCIIKLSERCQIMGLEVDTAHFTGNHVPQISFQVADLSHTQETQMVINLPGSVERLIHGGIQGTGHSPSEVKQAEQATSGEAWKDLLPKTSLQPGYEESRLHFFPLPQSASKVATHLRVNYFPDGGVARLRVWGYPSERAIRKVGPLYSPIKTGRTCSVVSHKTETNDDRTDMPSCQAYPHPELSAAVNGGLGVMCSNKHYGEPWHLIQSNLGRDMGDGWETARHPDRPDILVQNKETGLVDNDLSDWCILQLGSVATSGVSRVLLDTKHFRGNYPESVYVEACCLASGENEDASVPLSPSLAVPKFETAEWFPLIPRGRMAPDSEHVYEAEKGQIANAGRPVSHVRVSIYPDGGLSRVRIYGATGLSSSFE